MKLIIAEKPSVARDIARVLGGGQNGPGFISCGQDIIITWCIGHLLQIAAPEQMNPAWKAWNARALPLIPTGLRFMHVPVNDDLGKQIDVIRGLMKGASEVVNACDAGREGELIWRHVVEHLGWQDRRVKGSRMWLRSMTPEAIKEAWEKRESASLPKYENLACAAKAREEADWLLGLSMTRAVTLANPRPTVKKGASVWSVGRVQTPVLGLIVRRDEAIENFKVETFWRVEVMFDGAKGLFGAWLDVPQSKDVFGDDLNRFKNKDVAEQAARSAASGIWDCKDEGKPGIERPPGLFSLGGLQQTMSRKAGWSAQRTLEIAQECYEKHKILSYPRTESAFLPSDFIPTADRIFSKVTAWLDLSGGVNPSNSEQAARLFDSNKVSDHYAIIPTETKPADELPETCRLLWETVAHGFALAFAPNAHFIKTERVLERSDGFHARTSGKVYKVEGWKSLAEIWLGKPQQEDEIGHSELVASNAQATSIKADAVAGKTTPPKPYDEASLLAVMENIARVLDGDDEEADSFREAISARGLGTPATRAGIIETLIARAFIERRTQGKKPVIKSTAHGRELIGFLNAHEVGKLALPDETARWEVRLQGIERGEETERSAFLSELVAELRSHLEKMHASIQGESAKRSGVALDVLCPKSGEPVLERATYYVFPGWPELKAWKEQRGRSISASDYAQGLEALEKGMSTPLVMFKSKAGNEYRAGLAWKVPGCELDFALPSQDGENVARPVPSGSQWNGEPIMETEKYFVALVGKKTGLRLKLWKRVSGRDMTAEDYLQVLQAKRDKSPPPVFEFWSEKKQKSFSAGVDLEQDGRVKFVFNSNA